jgi:hypothetical protein
VESPKSFDPAEKVPEKQEKLRLENPFQSPDFLAPATRFC